MKVGGGKTVLGEVTRRVTQSCRGTTEDGTVAENEP